MTSWNLHIDIHLHTHIYICIQMHMFAYRCICLHIYETSKKKNHPEWVILWVVHQKRLLRYGLKPQKIFFKQALTISCIRHPSVALSLSQGECKHKNHTPVNTLQLTVSQRQSYRSQKARLAHLETSSRLWTVIYKVIVAFSFFPFFGGGTWYFLCAEFYGLSGTSIMESC